LKTNISKVLGDETKKILTSVKTRLSWRNLELVSPQFLHFVRGKVQKPKQS